LAFFLGGDDDIDSALIDDDAHEISGALRMSA